MKKRIISGLIFATISIGFIVVGGKALDIFLLLIAIIGLYEFYNAFSKKGYSPFKPYGLFNIGILALMLYKDSSYMSTNVKINGIGEFNVFPPLFLLSILALLSILVFKHSKYNIVDIAITVFGGFYVTFLLSYFIKIRNLDGGLYLFFIAIIGAIAADTFAYFVGKAIGKRKLIPAVSPNKTIAGSVGGFLGATILLTLIGFTLIKTNTYIDMAIYHYAIIGAISGLVAQIGDLVASSIKRYTGIKDFGKLIPGHGGILDRIDSYLFVIPVVYYYVLIFVIGGV